MAVINISRKLAYHCIKDDAMMLATAIALCTKNRYRNSAIYKPNTKDLCKLVNANHKRVNKALKKGLECGLLFYDDFGTLHSRPLHNRYHKNNIQIECDDTMTLSQAIQAIRKACLQRHIAVMNEVRNTLKDCAPEERTIESVKRMKRALRIVRRMNLKSFKDGTSYAVMAKLLKVSKSTARRLIKSMIDKGEITAEACYDYIPEYNGINIDDKFRQYEWEGKNGYVFSQYFAGRGNLCFCRYGNRYELNTRYPEYILF